MIVLAGALVPQHYRSAQVEDWNSTSQWLVQHYKSGDGLVCYDNWQGCQVSMEYYLLHVYPESGARFTPDSPGYFNWATYGDNFPATDATNPQKLAAYGKKHAHIFFIVARLSSENTVENARNAQKWLDEHYRLVGEIKTPTVNVRLYNTGSGPRQ